MMIVQRHLSTHSPTQHETTPTNLQEVQTHSNTPFQIAPSISVQGRYCILYFPAEFPICCHDDPVTHTHIQGEREGERNSKSREGGKRVMIEGKESEREKVARERKKDWLVEREIESRRREIEIGRAHV